MNTPRTTEEIAHNIAISHYSIDTTQYKCLKESVKRDLDTERTARMEAEREVERQKQIRINNDGVLDSIKETCQRNYDAWNLAQKERDEALDALRKSGEIVKDCISLSDVLESSIRRILICNQRKLDVFIEETGKGNTVGKTSKNSGSESVSNQGGITKKESLQGDLTHLELELERYFHKLFTGERLKSQTNAPGVKLSLNPDLSTDTTTIIRNLMLLNGYVARVMGSFTENLNEALTPLMKKVLEK